MLHSALPLALVLAVAPFGVEEDRWIALSENLAQRARAAPKQSSKKRQLACDALRYLDRVDILDGNSKVLLLRFEVEYLSGRDLSALGTGREILRRGISIDDRFRERMDFLENPADALSEATCPDPRPLCGDFLVEGAEQCDDGNPESEDGCSSRCETESLHAPDAARSDDERSVRPSRVPMTADAPPAQVVRARLVHGTIGRVSLANARAACSALGAGWRLPSNIEELNIDAVDLASVGPIGSDARYWAADGTTFQLSTALPHHAFPLWDAARSRGWTASALCLARPGEADGGDRPSSGRAAVTGSTLSPRPPPDWPAVLKVTGISMAGVGGAAALVAVGGAALRADELGLREEDGDVVITGASLGRTSEGQAWGALLLGGVALGSMGLLVAVIPAMLDEDVAGHRR